MADKGKLIKLADCTPKCPPKHSKADAYALVTKETCGAEHLSFFVVDIHPGGEAEPADHPGIEHGYLLLQGKAQAKVSGEEFIMKPYDFLWIPKGATHEIRPIGNEKIRFAVFSSPMR